jgi:hypothetical protein
MSSAVTVMPHASHSRVGSSSGLEVGSGFCSAAGSEVFCDVEFEICVGSGSYCKVGVTPTYWMIACTIPILVALGETVVFVSGDNHLDAPLFGGASNASAAAESYTILFSLQSFPIITNAVAGLRVITPPNCFVVILMG